MFFACFPFRRSSMKFYGRQHQKTLLARIAEECKQEEERRKNRRTWNCRGRNGHMTRPGRVKLGRIRGQVHGDQDLLGDGFALDEGDRRSGVWHVGQTVSIPKTRRSRLDHLICLALDLGLSLHARPKGATPRRHCPRARATADFSPAPVGRGWAIPSRVACWHRPKKVRPCRAGREPRC